MTESDVTVRTSAKSTDKAFYWRLDPVELAAQLHDFIEYVLKCSGSEKVDLQCHSFGGIVTSTYVKLYGVGRLHTVVFNSTAVFGETYTGELMTGKLILDKNAIVNFMSYVFDNNEYEHLLNSVIKLFSDAGLLDFLCKFNGMFTKGSIINEDNKSENIYQSSPVKAVAPIMLMICADMMITSPSSYQNQVGWNDEAWYRREELLFLKNNEG